MIAQERSYPSVPVLVAFAPVDSLRRRLKRVLPSPVVWLIARMLGPVRRVRDRVERWRRRRRVLRGRLHRRYATMWRDAHSHWWNGVTRPTGPAVALPLGVAGPVVHVRPGTCDVLLYEDVVIQERYGRLPLRDVRTIVDCGANIGLVSAYLLSRFPMARTIAIEPDPANHHLCLRNLAVFGERATVVQAAVWGERQALCLADSSLSGTWASRVEPSEDLDDRPRIEGIDLPSLLAQYDLDAIDLLKIDIEGAEAGVFSSPDMAWLDRVRTIEIELESEAGTRAFFTAMRGRNFDIWRTGDVTVAMRRDASLAPP